MRGGHNVRGVTCSRTQPDCMSKYCGTEIRCDAWPQMLQTISAGWHEIVDLPVEAIAAKAAIAPAKRPKPMIDIEIGPRTLRKRRPDLRERISDVTLTWRAIDCVALRKVARRAERETAIAAP